MESGELQQPNTPVMLSAERVREANSFGVKASLPCKRIHPGHVLPAQRNGASL